MKTYLEISIAASEQQREFLIPTMVELGCEGFQETDTDLLCYINKDRWSDESYQLFQHEMKSILNTISSNAAIKFREIQEENWNEQWEKTIQPIEIGNSLTVKPSWAEYKNIGNRTIIQIDPKMSFGTGYHETTRLTMRLMERYVKKGHHILDVGTGTGILAITAIKLGAGTAIGIDTDDWSIENALENILANDVGKLVTITNQPLTAFMSLSSDIITANLTLNTNLEMLDQFQRILTPGGCLLLSGLLVTDEGSMIEGLRRHSFLLGEQIVENEWLAMVATKPQ